jgi:hypothetical protein
VGRPVRAVSANARPLDDDAQTQFMSRPLVPASPVSALASSRRAPIFAEERTLVDVPRPADASEDRTIVAPLVFPKAAPRATLLTSRRASSPPPSAPVASKPPSSGVRHAPRASQPPPVPAARASSSPPPLPSAPRVAPPPPPSATKLIENAIATPAPLPAVPVTAPPPAPTPSAQASSPALVRDVTPSVPPPAPTAKRAREPMLLLAAAFGMLGVIFTMGIAVGLIVSLRSHADSEPVVASHEAPSAPLVAAAAAQPAASDPTLPAKPTRVATVKIPPAEGLADTLAEARETVAPPAPTVTAPAPRVAHASFVAMSAPVARQVTPPHSKRPRAASSDADMEAASAADDLAKAQLEASLR